MNFIQNLYGNPVVHSIGWTLLHACWQIIVVVLILKIILWATEKYTANLAYTLAVMSLLTVCVWSTYTFISQYDYFDHEIKMAAFEAEESGRNELLIVDQTDFTLSESVKVEEGKNWESKLQQVAYYLPVLVVLWLIGTLFLIIRFITSWMQIRRLRTIGLVKIEKAWLNRLEKLKQQIGVQKTVQFFKSNLVHEPVTIGHLKPFILVPIGVFTHLSPEMVETVLLHELAHIKRSDFLINIIQSLVEIIFFFHPGIWWVSKKVRQTREHACDDLAVKTCKDPMLYAKTLTQIQSSYLNTKNNLAMSATGKTGEFTTRIKRLFGYTESTTQRRKSFAFSSLLFTCLLAFAFTNPFNQDLKTNNFPEEINSAAAMMFVIMPSTKQSDLDKIVETFKNENIKLEFSEISFSPFGLLENLRADFIMPDKSMFMFSVEKMVFVTIALDWNKKNPLDIRFTGRSISMDRPEKDKGTLADMGSPYTSSLNRASLIGGLGFERNKESKKDELILNFSEANTPAFILNGKEVSKEDLILKKLETKDVTAITKLNREEAKTKHQIEHPNGAYEIFAKLDRFGNKRSLFEKDKDAHLKLHDFKILYKGEVRSHDSSPMVFKPMNNISISASDCNKKEKAFHVFNEQEIETPEGHCYPPQILTLTEVDSFFILDEKLATDLYGQKAKFGAYVYYYKFKNSDLAEERSTNDIPEKPMLSIDTIQINNVEMDKISGMTYAPICYLNNEKLEVPASGFWPEEIKTIETFDSLILISGEVARKAYNNDDGKESIWKFFKQEPKVRFPISEAKVLENEFPTKVHPLFVLNKEIIFSEQEGETPSIIENMPKDKIEKNYLLTGKDAEEEYGALGKNGVYVMITKTEFKSKLLQESFRVTPNPISEKARLEFMLPRKTDIRITVFNSNGKLVNTIASQALDKGVHRFDWQPHNLPNGIYHIQVQTKEKSFTKSVVFQKG